MTSLDLNLKHHIHYSLRPAVVEYLWGPQSSRVNILGQAKNLEGFFALYFGYYNKQCDLIGRHAKGKYSSVESHRDIMGIAQLLQQPLTREEVRKHMSSFLKVADKEQHETSINLVARLLLMIKFGDVPHECRGGRYLEWSYGSLPEFVHNYFSCPPARSHDRIKLEKSFSALNLQRIAGIEIWWTDNLADHLRMMDDDKAIAVFHHASFLDYQIDNHANSPIFPDGFIEETLRTIALLLPKYDQATRNWYRKVASNPGCHLDMQLVEIGNLNAESRQLENFKYWHDRLVILKQVYDDARPTTLSQWWYDRRNGAQWYPFWIALWVLVLTTFFGLVQCIEGALQAYKAFRS
ncbi:uncharacterized protein BP5553_04830 [Venustampulla echinocandica]|uniref:Uncharacterized protein n=1 Tax=Venustampulla echinocandica TaxID=2656787 RepID=A0A370TPE8_9HELO|nr:uncharacterized protein BP5553_04830 [Venustampulla echinocandica]RDL37397.1 hypothetical protein BP5553_04830 [Venustampulla echinocandica]